MSNLHYPQFCALARAAELIGERWTLLIIRELLLGPKRFGDLQEHLDGMSPTLLTTRLTALIDSNVVRRISLPRPVNAHGKKSADFTITGGQSGTAIQKGIAGCRATLEAPFDVVLQIIGMSVSLELAMAANRAKVSGSATLVHKLPQLFDLAERRREVTTAK